MTKLRIGLVMNPRAGVGGTLGLKGSDAITLHEALQRGAQPRAAERLAAFLIKLNALSHIHWLSWSGLGAEQLKEAGGQVEVVGSARQITGAEDTQRAVQDLSTRGIDLLIFVGGDGTARDVLGSLPPEHRDQLSLGLPAGVKMHSGVFAVSPQAAATIVNALIETNWVAPVWRSVRDFVSAKQNDGPETNTIVVSEFGTLRAPELAGYLQHTKEGGRESEPLALEEIWADVEARMAEQNGLLLGPGGTLAYIKERLGAATPTLRGFDYREKPGRWRYDLDASELAQIASFSRVVLSFSRGQGFLLGRGNQQLAPEILQKLDWFNEVEIVASRSKLLTLEQRPLLLDSGEIAWDLKHAGLYEITTGYEDRLLYPVCAASQPESNA